MIELAQESLNNGLDAETLAAGNAVAQQFATSDWLGPLAPIALSPFFGLAALSGTATYGPEWLQERSSLFGDGSPLNNPVLFWTMATLAILTSLPRFTKVSKPIALLAENLESYSAVIILVAVRFMGTASGTEVASDPMVLGQPVMLTAGITSLPLDIALAIFAALNVLVINLVKLFFEFMVWLIPIPAIDAIVEATNKSVCAALMGVYLYSPLIATVLNLAILGFSLLVSGWCYRRLCFYREVAGGPILAWLMPSWFRQQGDTFRAFSPERIAGLPSYTPLRLTQQPGTLEIRGRWLWKSCSKTLTNCSVEQKSGLVVEELVLSSDQGDFVFKHRKWISGDELATSGEVARQPAVT
ncbi:MAG: hypothetical protein AB8B50_07235 [Pirellulaceae bacterium]